MSQATITEIKNHLESLVHFQSREEMIGGIRVLLNMIEMRHPTYISVYGKNYRNRITVIKELRSLLNLGLKEAKDMTETDNGFLFKTKDLKVAENFKRIIGDACDLSITGPNAVNILFGDK